jgi:hypothetical protein
LLHHCRHGACVLSKNQQVNVVTGDVVGQQGDFAIEQCLPQADAIALSIYGKLQEELPVVTPMGKVIGEAWNNVPICPGHVSTIHELAADL